MIYVKSLLHFDPDELHSFIAREDIQKGDVVGIESGATSDTVGLYNNPTTSWITQHKRGVALHDAEMGAVVEVMTRGKIFGALFEESTGTNVATSELYAWTETPIATPPASGGNSYLQFGWVVPFSSIFGIKSVSNDNYIYFGGQCWLEH